jgi:hypothetical protein
MSGANAVPGSGTPWPGFKYVPVRGLMDRHISRWLRTQRKNMRGFFASQGLTDLVLRMDAIKRSNAGMMEKNRRFQEILNEYSRRATPQPAAQTADPQAEGSPGVAVHAPGAATGAEPVVGAGSGPDAGSGVPGVAGGTEESVIEE